MQRFGRAGVALLVVCAVACGGPDPVPEPDSGIDASTIDASTSCESNDDCANESFCDGAETCDPTDPAADARGCVAADSPCTAAQTCDEEADRCVTECPSGPDADGDGFDSIDCGGTDCDDSNDRVFPGATEICDAADVDEDCDPETFGIRDGDGDGEPDASCCNADPSGGAPRCGTDCDDTRAGVSPVATEACNDRDDDCDGAVDEGALETFYPDADGDDFGDASGTPVEACFQPAGYAARPTDCDDTRSGVNPGLGEQCDMAMLDEDCDGVANPESLCSCTDGMSRPCTAPGVCAAGTETCAGGMWGACSIAPITEVCNGLDDDCDGVPDEMLTVVCYHDGDNDGYAATGAALSNECPDPARGAVGGCPNFTTNRAPASGAVDCDDGAAAVNPGATEVCDRVDSNCSSGGGVAVDEDADDDGHAPIGAACAGGFARDDCRDDDGSVHPGVAELCDRIDSDCSSGGGTDVAEDVDGDGHASPTAMCTGGFPKNDCLDTNASVYPGQSAYFGTPYCANGSTPTRCSAGNWYCNGGLCPPVCSTCAPLTRASFDYDCDASTVVQPVQNCTATVGDTCFGTVCRSGPNASGGTCGEVVAMTTCSCGGGGPAIGECGNVASTTGRLGCH